ncbi:OmpA family protein [Thalassospira australica]|uniref:OmpA family protein n=1 Tax=Thalassospira australica TaxID=1528106 RepID=UPI000519EE25|nr:OmpA family protein [Thalassospira australica]
MKGYSKISVLAMMAALGTTVLVARDVSAQQYSPVSVNNSVQVNWDVADGYGGQPTVPQYLSSNVSRDHIVMPGGDLIFPETKPKSAFLASEQFAYAGGSGNDDGGFETVVIDGSSGGSAFPTQSEFYGVPGVSASAPAPRMDPGSDDGANQTIVMTQPEPTAAPRSKPAAPTVAASSSASNAPTPLTKPEPAPASAPAPAPEPEITETADAPPAPAPAPAAPAAPEVEPINNTPEAPAAPAPDTTQPATEMADSPAPVAEQPAPAAPAPVAEEASIPPETAPEPMPSTGADEYSLGFAAESFELSQAAIGQLDQVIAAMGQDDSLRIQLQAYAAGDGANASKARRLSLSRALQVRSYLIDKGVRSTRIDVRALGANVPSGPSDRVDIKTVQR